MLETIYMQVSVIGFIGIMIYTLITEVKKHPILGLFITPFKGTLLATPWFIAWPITIWFYIYFITRSKEKPPFHEVTHDTESNDRGLIADLLDIQEEPIYDILGNEVGKATTMYGKAISTDKFFTTPDDIERDPFGDLREK